MNTFLLLLGTIFFQIFQVHFLALLNKFQFVDFYIHIISVKNQPFNEIHSVTIFYLRTIPSPPFIPPMPELP